VDWTEMSTAPTDATAAAASNAFAKRPMLTTVKIAAHKVKTKQHARVPGFCSSTILPYEFIRNLAMQLPTCRDDLHKKLHPPPFLNRMLGIVAPARSRIQEPPRQRQTSTIGGSSILHWDGKMSLFNTSRAVPENPCRSEQPPHAVTCCLGSGLGAADFSSGHSSIRNRGARCATVRHPALVIESLLSRRLWRSWGSVAEMLPRAKTTLAHFPMGSSLSADVQAHRTIVASAIA
jgi:hypothetical protein